MQIQITKDPYNYKTNMELGILMARENKHKEAISYF